MNTSLQFISNNLNENQQFRNEIFSNLCLQGGRNGLQLKSIRKSHNPAKKYDAVFEENGRTKTVSFGANSYSDYTKHHDTQRKDRYLARHHSRDNWNNPTSPGSLSRYILWNKPSMKESVKDFKKKFHL